MTHESSPPNQVQALKGSDVNSQKRKRMGESLFSKYVYVFCQLKYRKNAFLNETHTQKKDIFQKYSGNNLEGEFSPGPLGASEKSFKSTDCNTQILMQSNL